MPKHSRSWDKNRYIKFLEEGRGQGELSEYKPWIAVQDFPSKGMVSRVYGSKAKRIHHLLSSNELYYFYTLDWSDLVIDIKEQFPLLDLELVMQIADKIGIRYPCDNISGFPYVLTSDFMIVTTSGLKVRTIKMASELKKRRVIEKLEIERRYWQEQNVDWAIITENEINKRKANNIEWLAQSKDLSDFSISDDLSDAIILRFMECCISSDMTYRDVADKIEIEFGLCRGMGICVFKHLAYQKRIVVDVDASQLPDEMKSTRKSTAMVLDVI
jgi:hypothetical protein